ncbi:hypothetical protein [Tuwongella immobilis]|uniref:Uncharacterized protein n=1 Tax=Tuwongella immobilis TaxID=692036 RepID=A0A6C2YNA2_9BACT|nr:hypothetical protein [Tuwongella immobilis]VIP02603.1 unnamed protein product [Tuwongella immobilis]VTS01897.1 unnamed protein product [Tuwongella immobilis]
MSSYQIPEWLKLRKGDIRQGVTATTRVVMLDGQPQYRLFVTPAGGKFTCAVSLANSGKRLDQGKHYNSVEDAFNGGLTELAQALGWIE